MIDEPIKRCHCGSRKVAGFCSFQLGMFCTLTATFMFLVVWRLWK